MIHTCMCDGMCAVVYMQKSEDSSVVGPFCLACLSQSFILFTATYARLACLVGWGFN